MSMSQPQFAPPLPKKLKPRSKKLKPRRKHKRLQLLWGADEIAAFIDRPVRATYHLLETKKIPAEKVGAIWVGNPQKIAAVLTGDDASA